MAPGLTRRAATLAFAVGQVALPGLLFANGFEPAQAPRPSAGPTPVEPAGYAFIIWGLIYLCALAYALYQARPTLAGDPLLARIGWLTAGGYGLTCLWLVVARVGPLWATVPVIAGMLCLLASAFLIACRWPGRASAGRRWLVTTPLALFAGWLTAATFVNAAEVLPLYGFGRFGLSVEAFSLGIVAAASLLALVILRLSRWNLAYGLTVTWALGGIVVANLQRDLSTAVALLAGGIALGLLVALAIMAARMMTTRRGRMA